VLLAFILSKTSQEFREKNKNTIHKASESKIGDREEEETEREEEEWMEIGIEFYYFIPPTRI
jgi:hypothetical protein